MPAPAAPVSEDPVDGVVHVVTRGQTLWRIARAYGVGVDQLAAVNGIPDPSRIDVGQALLVPGAPVRLDVPPHPAALEGSSAGTPAGKIQGAAFLWPLEGGRILSRFGDPRRTHRHRGVDIAAPRGRTVRAAAAGRVVYSGARMRGYGKTIIVEHGGGFQSLYAHNSRLLVARGDRVQRGQAIARVGRTGNATGEHCHFEIRRDRVPVDPLPYLEPR